MENAILPEELDRTVRAELEPGERIEWVQQPGGNAPLPWGAYLPVMMPGIPFTAFSIVWMVASTLHIWNGGDVERAPGIPLAAVPLLILPFLAIGLGALTSPYWHRRRLRRAAARSAYVITDRRAILFDQGYQATRAATFPGPLELLMGGRRGLQIRTFEPHQLGSRERIQREDGSGDILFADVIAPAASPLAMFQLPFPGLFGPNKTGFLTVPDVKEVEGLLRNLASQAIPPAARGQQP